MYDIIGDIHGEFEKLAALLALLGYEESGGVHSHPTGRRAVFVGDLIDRGPRQLDVLRTVRAMIDAGSGLAVMGNHELNAIGFATLGPDGKSPLRAHSESKRRQHEAFLAQAGEGSTVHKEVVEWMKSLPAFLELDGIRVCHAWWDEARIDEVRRNSDANGRMDRAFLADAFDRGTQANWALEGITKGAEVRLPAGSSYQDHEGHERHDARVRWWDTSATSYRDAALVPSACRHQLPDALLPEPLPGVQSDVPVFVGHYWLSGTPRLQHPRLAVLDFSVAAAGPLVAYRWDGEQTLSDDKLVWI